MDKFVSKLKLDFTENQKLIQLISKIDLYKGKWNAIEKTETIYLKELRRIATIASIGSSTRIEGSTLTDKEVKELLENVKISELKNREEQEVMGYYDTLELIYESYESIPLSENYIKQLHQNLLKHSSKDDIHRGNYKTISNKIVANYPEEIQKVIFSTTEVFLVENEMREMIEWTNKTIEDKSIHPLIVIAVFVYEFLSIHPFQDGNGRLSRLLTTLLLLKNEYVFIQYVSFENLIEKSKKQYYEVLMEGQKNRNTENENKENVTQWLFYFLDKIEMLSQKLDAKYDILKSKGGYLNERQKEIKRFIEKNEPTKLADIYTYFETNSSLKFSIHTLKKDLLYLKNEKIIQSIGKGKGTVYLMEK